ncbi:Protein EARLY FLOWERING 4 [Morella rubra]|nr:Protein EARLY FLOWERING 4 [Morella rubra]
MDHDLPSTHNHSKALTTTGETAEEGGDAEVWDALNQRFRQVQIVLDRNRALIQQVNENHQSRIADNMVKNVALIQEINSNISKVVSLYSDLSSNFSAMFHQREPKSSTDDRTQSPRA